MKSNRNDTVKEVVDEEDPIDKNLIWHSYKRDITVNKKSVSPKRSLGQDSAG